MPNETSHTPSSASPPSSMKTFTATVTPGLISSPSAIPTTSTENDGSKIQSSADTTITTTLIVLGVVLPVLVVFSTAFWCWYVKRRPKSGMVIGRRSELHSAPISPHEKSTFNLEHAPSSQSVQIAKWAAHSKSQRISTTYWSDSSTLSTECRPPSPCTPLPQSVQKAKPISRSNSQSSMSTYRSGSSDSSSSTEYRPPSPSMISIAESASMYSQASYRSSKPGSLRSHRTGRAKDFGNPFGSKFPSLSTSNYSTERHIYADSSLAVPTRPTRLSVVHEDGTGH